MSGRKFTPEERAGIARAFKEAKGILWDGSGTESSQPQKQKYICHALDKTGRWKVNHAEFSYFGMAKEVVQRRLGECYSLERWLRMNGVSNNARAGTGNPELMQEHRHAWINMLIEEFSKPEQRLIYTCHCGCPRICRDAVISINDPSHVVPIDGVSCPECNYEGRHYFQVPVAADFDLDNNLTPEYVAKNGTEVVL